MTLCRGRRTCEIEKVGAEGGGVGDGKGGGEYAVKVFAAKSWAFDHIRFQTIMASFSNTAWHAAGYLFSAFSKLRFHVNIFKTSTQVSRTFILFLFLYKTNKIIIRLSCNIYFTSTLTAARLLSRLIMCVSAVVGGLSSRNAGPLNLTYD